MPNLVRSLESVVRRKTTRYPLPTTHWRLRRPGFTLIELLVVMAIIAILIGAATVSYSIAQKKGRDSKRKADLKTIQQALELYFQENKYYPPWPQSWDWCSTISNPSDTRTRDALEPTYIKKVPTDPLYSGSSKDYVFHHKNAYEYELAAVLENANDPENGTYNYVNCSTIETYDYQVTSP